MNRWQTGDSAAKNDMTNVFDAAIAGEFDENFRLLAPPDEVHSTASVHMLGLALLHDLYGIGPVTIIMKTPIGMSAPI